MLVLFTKASTFLKTATKTSITHDFAANTSTIREFVTKTSIIHEFASNTSTIRKIATKSSTICEFVTKNNAIANCAAKTSMIREFAMKSNAIHKLAARTSTLRVTTLFSYCESIIIFPLTYIFEMFRMKIKKTIDFYITNAVFAKSKIIMAAIRINKAHKFLNIQFK